MKYKIRSMIVAPKGHMLVQFDLSQAESWVVAFLSGDDNMKHSLQFGDIHTDTAIVLYDLPLDTTKATCPKDKRYGGKKSNHAFSYQMSANRFVQVYNKEALDIGMPEISISQATPMRKKWLERYAKIPQVWWPSIQEGLNQSRTLITPYGRIRTFFTAWGSELFKEATAFVPQSTVADHCNGAVQKELGIQGGILQIYKRFVATGAFKIINQSHDSFIAEVPTERVDEVLEPVTALFRRPLVINNSEFTIPVTVETGERWAEMQERKV